MDPRKQIRAMFICEGSITSNVSMYSMEVNPGVIFFTLA